VNHTAGDGMCFPIPDYDLSVFGNFMRIGFFRRADWKWQIADLKWEDFEDAKHARKQMQKNIRMKFNLSLVSVLLAAVGS
jgi:hypothetical protein